MVFPVLTLGGGGHLIWLWGPLSPRDAPDHQVDVPFIVFNIELLICLYELLVVSSGLLSDNRNRQLCVYFSSPLNIAVAEALVKMTNFLHCLESFNRMPASAARKDSGTLVFCLKSQVSLPLRSHTHFNLL